MGFWPKPPRGRDASPPSAPPPPTRGRCPTAPPSQRPQRFSSGPTATSPGSAMAHRIWRTCTRPSPPGVERLTAVVMKKGSSDEQQTRGSDVDRRPDRRAGPTGMTLAVSLRQLGLDCVVIDQLPEPANDARAAFVQPRTLEYLRRIHVAGPLVDDGIKGRGVAFADRDRDLIRLSYDTVDSPYPFLLMIPQSQT